MTIPIEFISIAFAERKSIQIASLRSYTAEVLCAAERLHQRAGDFA